MGKTTAAIKVADEVWIATALLHREHPVAADFSQQEIKARIERENLTGDERQGKGISPHISVHCVANRPPNGGRYRMLFATSASRRRLFRHGDPYHPGRDGKIVPKSDEIPHEYHHLLDWYSREWAPSQSEDPLLSLAKRHRSLWKRTDPDEYVRRLREGFE